MPVRPAITDLAEYPATGGVIALCVTATVAKLQGYDIAILAMDSHGDNATPWSYVTSAFPHGGILHLVFNVYWMWVFGTAVERTFGSLRTVGMCVLFASTSAAAEYAVFDGGIGLSGVNYGLFAMLLVLSRGDGPLRYFIDERTKAIFVVWFVACIVATITDVMPVANVAHGVGMAEGALLGKAMVDRPRRPLMVTCLVTVSIVLVLGATQWRCYVNLSGTAGASVSGAAYQASEAGRDSEAARLYERALCFDSTNCTSWYNLGVVYIRLERRDAALDAFRRAMQCQPSSAIYRETLASQLGFVGYKRLEAGSNDDAYRLYQEALSIDDNIGMHWFNFAIACERLDRTDEAVAGFAKAAALEPLNDKFRAARDKYKR